MRVGDIGEREWEFEPRRTEPLIRHASPALGHPPRSIIAQQAPGLLRTVPRHSHHAGPPQAFPHKERSQLQRSR